MTTLKDIGAELGLSPATVSRALNGFPEVNAKTRQMVEEAARRLNYSPNQAAKKLVSGRSGMVGLVLPRVPGAADPTIAEIMFGLSEALAAADIDLVVHATAAPDPLTPYKRLIAKKTLDGFIVNAPELRDVRVEFLDAEGVPFVVHGKAEMLPADYAYYDIDNESAAADAVHLLADLGHQRIAFLNGPRSSAYAYARAKGFRRAAAERGIAMPGFALVGEITTEAAAYSAALALFSGWQAARPTAILCASTVLAAGVSRAAADLGLSVPGDLSVVAHDDAIPQLHAADFDPALTVTRAPLHDACGPLAAAMVGVLAGESPRAFQTTAPAELIIRRSTGPVPPKGDTPW